MSISLNKETAHHTSKLSQVATLVDLLHWRTLQDPDRLAYTFITDGEEEEVSWTYKELDRRARSIGAWLQALNAQGERVLLLYPPGLEYIAGFFGCLYAGAIAVPTYPPRAHHSIDRLLAIVADSQATAILTIGPIRTKLEGVCSQIPSMERMRWLSTDAADDTAEQWIRPVLGSEHTAFLQYTSGSTSTPKGVIVSHGNLLHNERIIQQTFGQTENSTIVGWLPLYHDMGLIGNVLQSVYAGARCVLMSPTGFLQRPLRWLEAISRNRATTSGGPNFAYELCVRRSAAAADSSLDLSSWGVAFNGAEPIRAATLEKFAATFGPYGFRREAFHPCYGLAEATLLVTGKQHPGAPAIVSIQVPALEKNRVVETSICDSSSYSLVSCGGTAPEQRVVIVDPELLTECAADEVGEVWVAGPSVAQGYWNSPDETAITFRARLRNNGDDFFLRTGDLGFLREGELFLTGRLKDLIIIRGLNHYPQDIEFTVEGSHAALRRGGGAAFSVEVQGEERLVVVQEVEFRRQVNVTEVAENICQAVSEKHELEIQSVVLIKPGSIPKTSSGKIQRRACRTLFLAGGLEVIGQWQAASAAADKEPVSIPESVLQNPEDIESWLVSQLATRLGLEEGRVDTNQPIARYGLDSLMAIELMHGIESSLGVSLPMVIFLQSPTISQLAAQVRVQLSTLAAAPKKSIAAIAERVVEHSLSYGQRSLWFMHQLEPLSPAYNIASAMRIRAQLDLDSVRCAFQALVDRHPCLRTTFAATEGEPIQRVAEHLEIDFEQQDASLWTESALNEYLVKKSYLPFDLEEGPLLRVSIFKRSADEHVLLVNVHHIIADFWSLAVLMHELGVLYTAQKAGTSATLAPLILQYEDYVYWQAGMLSGSAGEQLWTFWQEQLAGDLPVLNLPLDRPRRPAQSHRGASRAFAISPELTRRLRKMGGDNDATLYMMLLAAFQILLHRYTGQEKILVGSPTAGRSWAELAGVVGYFVNPIVLQADLVGNPTVLEFLARVRATALRAFENQDYPFSLLVERLCPVRDPSATPLVQVIFAFQRAHLLNREGLASFALGETGSRLQLGELELQSIGLEQRVTQFDLTLTVAELSDGLAASLQYDTDVFDAVTIDRMAGHFQLLLEGIVAAPEQRICSVPLLAATERHQLLAEWNRTAAEYPRDKCIHQLFEAQAERSADAIAVVYEHEELSYAELDRRANQLAHHLRSLGVGRETLVAICVERSVEMLVGLLGILKAGAAYVPLDPSYPLSRLTSMLEDSQAPVVITQERLVHVLPAHGQNVICLDRDWETISRQSVEKPTEHVGPENLAYMIYTSGSTGQPKGVQIEHGSLLNLIFWHLETYGILPSDRATQVAGLGFDASVWEVWPYLAAGASIYLPDEETRISTLKLRDWIVAQGITVSFLPTPLAESLLSAEWPESTALRFLLTGGDRLSVYPPPSLNFKLVNHYGPTESTVVATATTVMPRDEALTLPPIGRPIANTEVYLLDENYQPAPVGVAAELYLGGQGLARGYLNRAELTAERFIPHPYSAQAGGRLYRTGDLARYLANGELEFLGRRDQQVKLRGFRIELGEIEAALAGHEAVSEAVVIVTGGEGEKRLVGCVRGVNGQAVSSGELGRYLKQKLPEYMVPGAYVMVEEIPLTANGKVDGRALAELAERAEGGVSGGEYVAARNPTEAVVAGIWEQVLGVERVGVEDNFFELGGHSLLATRVISLVSDAFKVEVPLRTIFEAPTVAGLSEVIGTLKSEGNRLPEPEIVPFSREQFRTTVTIEQPQQSSEVLQ
jgi:amino acid adenylation domain-containing protein